METIHWRDTNPATSAVALLSVEADKDRTRGLRGSEDLRPKAFATFSHNFRTGSGYSFELESVVRSPDDSGGFIDAVKRSFGAAVWYVSWSANEHDFPILAAEAMRQRRFVHPELAAAASTPYHTELHRELRMESGSYHENVQLAAKMLGIPFAPSVPSLPHIEAINDEAMLRTLCENEAVVLYLIWLHWRAFKSADARLFAYPADALTSWVKGNRDFRERHDELSSWILDQDFAEFAEGERDREAVGYPSTRFVELY